jgi:hypothetical protein
LDCLWPFPAVTALVALPFLLDMDAKKPPAQKGQEVLEA